MSRDLVGEIVEEQRRNYNQSFFRQPGTTEEQVDDGFLKIYETCCSFENAELVKMGLRGSVYTDDEAFEDNFNHAKWQKEQIYDIKKNEYDIVRARRMFTSIRAQRGANA